MQHMMMKCYTCDHKHYFHNGERSCNQSELFLASRNQALEEAALIVEVQDIIENKKYIDYVAALIRARKS